PASRMLPDKNGPAFPACSSTQSHGHSVTSHRRRPLCPAPANAKPCLRVSPTLRQLQHSRNAQCHAGLHSQQSAAAENRAPCNQASPILTCSRCAVDRQSESAQSPNSSPHSQVPALTEPSRLPRASVSFSKSRSDAKASPPPPSVSPTPPGS